LDRFRHLSFWAFLEPSDQDKIEIKKIDGITHIFNPAKPLI
jgi:hypothetical protein